ncbi:MAG: hypothetical protein RSD57_09735 [Comamonas sp.]
MSRHHSLRSLRVHLAPLAAAAALLCAAAGASAQLVQTNGGLVGADVITIGPNGVLSNTLGTTPTNINSNSYKASATGNQNASATTNHNQQPTASTPSVTQTVTGAITANSNAGKTGIDTTGTTVGNTGNRTGTQATVNDNSTTSTAAGNDSNAKLTLDNSAGITLGATSPVSQGTVQSVTAPVSATTQANLIGMDLLKRFNSIFSDTTWSNLQLDVNGNQASAISNANQAVNTVSLTTAGDVSLQAPVLSGVTQGSTEAVKANTTIGTLGIVLRPNILTSNPSNSGFNANGNSISADAQGNQSDNQLQISGANVNGSGNASLVWAASIQKGDPTHATGPVSADSTVTTLGVQNSMPLSSSNRYAVDQNAVTAQAGGNAANNQAQVSATGSIQNLNVAATSEQANSGVAATTRSSLLGVSLVGSANDQISVNGNTASAAVQGSMATNTASALANGDVAGSTASATNTQNHVSGAISASSNVTTLGSLSTGSLDGTQTVNDNGIHSSASGLDATNHALVRASGSVQASNANVVNGQEQTAGNISATSQAGQIGVSSSLLSTGDTSTVNGNAIQANAEGMQADNMASIAAKANVSGSNAGISNTQTHQGGNVSASSAATRIGVNVGGLSSGNQQTINGNRMDASARGTNAVNLASVHTPGTVTNAVASVLSNQTHKTGDVDGGVRVNLVGSSVGGSLNDQLVVNNNALSASATSQQASNTASLNGTAGINGSSASVSNTQLHQAGNVNAAITSLTSTSPSPSITDAVMVGGKLGTGAIDGSVQVSDNSAQADANVNLANNQVEAISGSALSGPGIITLGNSQTAGRGNAAAAVQVNYGVTGTRTGGNTAVVSGNSSTATASQNQALNTLAVQAGSDLGMAAPTLASEQSAAGNTSATTYTQLLTGTGTIGANGDTTITGNQSSSTARANVANNVLAISSGAAIALTASSLSNTQTNTGKVSATTEVQIPVGSTALTGAMEGNSVISGNAANAMGLGNAAFNALTADAGTALNTGSSLVLQNAQANTGAITANATLNAPVFSNGGTVTMTGNTGSATAMGNSAVNQINATALPSQLVAGLTLTSTQINTGNVTAMVNGSLTSTGGTSANLSGNQMSAIAVGNRSVSSMVIGVK